MPIRIERFLMPYEFVPAEKFFEHEGVSIYYVYKSNEIDQGRRTYWFDSKSDSDDDAGFDVRDLAANAKVLALATEPLDCDTEEGRRQILTLAIDAGLIE